MLAVIKMPHTEIKLNAKGEKELVEILQKHSEIDIVDIKKKESDFVPYEETFIYKETRENRIGERVKAMRRREGISQRELAKRSGMRQSHISEIENGKRSIGTAEVAKKFAKAFDEDYRFFL